MNYVEINVTVEPKEPGSDVLIAELSELNFESFVDTDDGFFAYIPEEYFNENQLITTFKSFSERLKISFLKKIIPQQNWNKEWESNFQPIYIGNKCLIRAPFHSSDNKYEFNVIIEPKMSFGTGHHQTTRLMIQKLLSLNVKNFSVLDMGCGTGVLAIVAGMMGANPIMAVDIDDWSIENTLENCERNNINNILVKKGNSQILEGHSFNTILANINKNVLLNDMSVYAQILEQKGNLILSGFFETDAEELKNQASKVGLKFENKAADEGWCLLHFTKI